MISIISILFHQTEVPIRFVFLIEDAKLISDPERESFDFHFYSINLQDYSGLVLSESKTKFFKLCEEKNMGLSFPSRQL